MRKNWLRYSKLFFREVLIVEILWSGGWSKDCSYCDMLGTKQEVSQDVALDTWDCFPSFHSCGLGPSWVSAWHFISDTAGVPRVL